MKPISSFRAAVAIGLVMTGLHVTGCGKALQMYEACEIGRPPPKELPSGTVHCPEGLGCVEKTEWYLPISGAVGVTRALKDDEGRIVARGYQEISIAHWGLFMSLRLRHVLEAEVPPEAFNDAPADWEVPPAFAALRLAAGLVAWANSGNDADHKEQSPKTKGSPPTPSDLRATLRSTIEKMREALHQTYTERKKEAQERAEKPVSAPRPGPFQENVPEHLLFTTLFLEALPIGKGEDHVGVGLFGFLVSTPLWEQAAGMRGAFTGVTKPGYQWERKDKDGVILRVRNLGGRRVRVETDWTVVRDPLLPLLGIRY